MHPDDQAKSGQSTDESTHTDRVDGHFKGSTERVPQENGLQATATDTEAGQEVDGHHPAEVTEEGAAEARLEEVYAMTPFLKKFSLELIFMLFMFPTMTTSTPMSDILLKKACLYIVGYNETICNNIDDYEDAEKEVQKVSNYYSTGRSIFTTIPGAFCSVIAGQYMSRYGVKAPLVIATVGAIASAILQLLTVLDMSVPLYWNILADFPGALTGGMIIFVTAMYTNVSVNAPLRLRKIRFMQIQFFLFLPLVLGTGLGGLVYQKIGIVWLQISSIALLVVPLVLIILFFTDFELVDEVKHDSWREVIRRSLGTGAMKNSFNAFVRPRPSHARGQLYLTFAALLIGVMGLMAADNLNFYYIKLMYHWDVNHYTTVNSIAMVVSFFFAIPMMTVFKIFKVTDGMMILIGFIAGTVKYAFFSMAYLGQFFYFANFILGIPFFVAIVSCRSHMSRLIAKKEVAVIFALVSALEKLVPILSDFGNMLIYNASLSFFPGLVYVVEAAFMGVAVVLSGISLYWVRTVGYPVYDELHDESSGEEQPKDQPVVPSPY